MFKQIRLIINTVKYLKFEQIFYQLYYRFKKRKSLNDYLDNDFVFKKLSFRVSIHSKSIIADDNHFKFLNLEKKFNKNVDWGFENYVKLWNYNLQYFDYLFQSNVPDDVKIGLLEDFDKALKNRLILLEPYPVSLRVINCIRYFSLEREDVDILKSVYAQLRYLHNNLEYHILGNHLLENAFALTMGGAAFSVEEWWEKGKRVLIKELQEQILTDGGHFELSPMYHKIILFRLLELIDWYENLKNIDAGFLDFIKQKAMQMLNWLHTVSFNDHTIPYFNDSANNIAYTNAELFMYAKRLGFRSPETIALKESGYRKYIFNNYQCVVDAGQIGAPYQAGHAHADALSFVIYYKDKPLLVEAGTSTYQTGERRHYERSSKAHNCVVVGDADQSDVWGNFRVGNRATTVIEEENDNKLIISHDGYKRNFGVVHQRSFVFEEDWIIISDSLISDRKNTLAKAYFHFYPGKNVRIEENCVFADDIKRLIFEKATNICVDDYQYSLEYNTYKAGKVVVVFFDSKLKSTIYLN